MLPALTPTQTVSSSDGRRSAKPDARSQWHRYAASPPSTSRTSVSRTSGTQRSASRLGNAVSSSTPTDFQPSPTVGVPGSCPLIHRHAWRGPAMGCPYNAVGMQRASDSAVGLSSSSTSASWMLAFFMPAEVRRSFMCLRVAFEWWVLETQRTRTNHRCNGHRSQSEHLSEPQASVPQARVSGMAVASRR